MINRRDQDGFTLVENLIALAILGLALAAFAQIASTQSSSVSRIDATNRALMFARSTVDRLGRDLPLAAGRSAGNTGDGGTWTLSISPFSGSAAPAAGLPSAFLVDLAIREPGAPAITLTTIKLAGR
jgi:general secretion pathway protein I